MSKSLKIDGVKFCRLLVLNRVENDKKGDSRWLCRCDCGKTTIVRGYHLTGGNIKSCGCIRKELNANRPGVHHKTGTKLYKIWAGIKQRCFNSKHKNNNRYKGRGITMCDEWKNNFTSFYNWAISNGYKKGLTVERINNDGNYEPSNCKWATRSEQANNTSRNHFIFFNGEKHTISQWSKKLGISYSALAERIRKNLPIERCFYPGKLSNNGVDFL